MLIKCSLCLGIRLSTVCILSHLIFTKLHSLHPSLVVVTILVAFAHEKPIHGDVKSIF